MGGPSLAAQKLRHFMSQVPPCLRYLRRLGEKTVRTIRLRWTRLDAGATRIVQCGRLPRTNWSLQPGVRGVRRIRTSQSESKMRDVLRYRQNDLLALQRNGKVFDGLQRRGAARGAIQGSAELSDVQRRCVPRRVGCARGGEVCECGDADT